jgi:glutaminyl-peptide cyclotransferase
VTSRGVGADARPRNRVFGAGPGTRTLGALLTALLLAPVACAAAAPAVAPAPDSPVAMLRVEVLAEQPHDRTAWTQGLELSDGTLYEGTGQPGRSQLRELDPATGELRRSVPLPGRLFGEGLTVVDDRIWQLTWRDGVALEWDRATLRLLRQVPLAGEGWGLCRDGARLVRSDGTDRLRFHDPGTFAEDGSVAVTLDGQPVTALNELECVDGEVWANVWRTERLVRIDPADGRVTAVVDASGLLDPSRRAGADVLNGVAATGGGEYLLTGKYWPALFRVRFVATG